jgi:hypothetical protein
MRLVVVTVTHEGDRPAFRQVFDQTQGELLPVVLDPFVVPVHGAVRPDLVPITTAELAPGDLGVQELAQQPL